MSRINVGEAVAAWLLHRFPAESPEAKEARILMDWAGRLHPQAASSTQAGDWQAKARDMLARLETMQPPNVILQQITMLGEARDILRDALAASSTTPASGGADCFGVDPAGLDALLGGCLKPEEINGESTVQQDRVRELLHWFVRLTQKSANPKWTTAHACELAYYIATNAGNRHIDLAPVREASFKAGAAITPAEREMLERIGAIPKAPPAAQEGVQGERGVGAFYDADGNVFTPMPITHCGNGVVRDAGGFMRCSVCNGSFGPSK